MGSFIEVNDTLQITIEQGFPADILDLQKHLVKPITVEDIKGKFFSFQKKDGTRFFQSDPVRVYLVHNIDGKWLFWGKIYIQSQTISKKLDSSGNWKPGEWETSGTFVIADIYEPGYQEIFTKREAPPGKSFFS
jgi:hypothetical protein